MPVTGFLGITFLDYDSEPGNTGVRVPVLSAANFDAQTGLRTAFVAALSALALGNLKETRYGNLSLQSISPASTDAAQRESKYRVDYHDNTTLGRFKIDIPTADTGVLDPNDRKHAEIGDEGVVDAFVTAFQNYVLSPDGNAVTVDEITFVGRNV